MWAVVQMFFFVVWKMYSCTWHWSACCLCVHVWSSSPSAVSYWYEPDNQFPKLHSSAVNCQDQCVCMRVSLQNASAPWLLFEGGGFDIALACCIKQPSSMSRSLHDCSRCFSLSKQLPHGDSHLNQENCSRMLAHAIWQSLMERLLLCRWTFCLRWVRQLAMAVPSPMAAMEHLQCHLCRPSSLSLLGFRV